MLGSIAGAALVAAAAWSLGRWLLRRQELPAAVHFAVGAAVLSVCVFALLSMHQARPLVLLTLGVACLAPLVRHRPSWPRCQWPPWWIALPGCVYAALYLVHALGPEIQADALSYHLELGVKGGFPERISFYRMLPQGIETLFAFAYALGGEQAAKLLHLAFLAATLPLIASWRSGQGWAGALFYAITPVVGVSATAAYTDAAMVFYIVATVWLVVQWWRTGDTRLLWPIGLCAGFCYAIKFTGGLIAPLALVAVLWRRQYRGALALVASSVFVAAPWVARSAILTGNPFAPLMNRWFPNPHFYIDTERQLGEYLRSYGNVQWESIGLELTLYGDALQGLLGPAWLLLPVALLSLRQRGGRLLLLASMLAGVPWFLNIGVRFLMPALPFLALALMTSVPRWAGVLLLLGHAVTSWPAVIAMYAPREAWALRPGWPQAAAEQRIAAMVHQHTPANARILDLSNAPTAIIRRDLVNGWQSALGNRLVQAMQYGATPDRGLFLEWRSRFPESRLTAVRVRFASGQKETAGLQEVRLIRPSGESLPPGVTWSLSAWPNVWDAPLAVDRNLVSAWRTWEPVRAGMFWEVEFPSPEPLAEVRVVAHRSSEKLRLELWGLETEWRALPLPQIPQPTAGLNLKPAVV
ncbi:MAG: glycosyltransferase family 39 protein, partial [Acidobacteria bacterium]|nr:glycosyltransferase family 39 protein [Acidobacteriota bacterium]